MSCIDPPSSTPYDPPMLRSTRSPVMAWLVLLSFSALITLPADGNTRPPRHKRDKMGKIAIFSTNQGATVEIDGKTVGTVPLKGPISLKPGTHSIRVHKRGHMDFDEAVTVEANKVNRVEAELIPYAGVVTITANVKGATVAVDGKLLGTTPLDKDIPAGKREITVQAPGHTPFRQLVDVLPGRPLALIVELKTAEIPTTAAGDEGSVLTEWWFWTIIGTVIAGGVTATVLLVPGAEEVEGGYYKYIQF